MKKINSIFITIAATCICCNSAYAGVGDVINIRLGGPITPTFYTNGAAIDDVSGQKWNIIRTTTTTLPITAGPLNFSNNLPSTVSGTYYIDGNIGFVGSSITGVDQPLMRGYLKPVTDAYCLFNGLLPGTYKIYVYSLNLTATTQGGHIYNFNLSSSGTLKSLTEKTALTTLDNNWMMQSVVVGSDGKLNMTLGANSVLNGLQLVQTTSMVPEPGSIALIGVGGVIFIGISKKRKKDENSIAV
jgi:hypothetical protein